MTDSLWHATAEYPTWAPGGIYLRTLRRGRVCYDHRGTKMKILDTGGCSTTVRFSGDQKTLALAPDTVVYLNQNRGPKPAPRTGEEGL